MQVWLARDDDDEGTLGLYWAQPRLEDSVWMPATRSGYAPLEGAEFPEVLRGECHECEIVLKKGQS